MLLLLYLPVAAGGYFIYGADVTANITKSLPEGPLRITIEILITLHLVCAFVIALNPFTQELEEHVKVPNSKFKSTL